MDNMNQSVYEKTIADLEAQLSRFELESEMLKQTRLDHSTPKDSGRKASLESWCAFKIVACIHGNSNVCLQDWYIFALFDFPCLKN